MAIFVNDRYTRLQATVPRFVLPSTVKKLDIRSTTLLFKFVAGDSSPASATLTADLLGITGVATWEITGGVLTGSADNVRHIDASSLTGQSATITATIVDGSVPYVDTVTLIKVTDGEPGVDGLSFYMWTKYGTSSAGAGLTDDPTGMSYMGIASNKTTATESTDPADYVWVKVQGSGGLTGDPGPRGAGQYFATGSAWDDAAANAATPGGNLVDDQVTIANGTVTYTKRWNGSGWAVPSSYLSGDLFVEKGIHGSKVDTNGLNVYKTDGTPILIADGTTPGLVAGAYIGSNLAQDLETLAGATAKANAAYVASVAAAAADATAKANAAQAAAAVAAQTKADLAQVTASAYADGIVTAEEVRAIADATAKANAAQAASIAAAAADATAKANVAAAAGATIGTNLFGQMTAANISTYIAGAAIDIALIKLASIGNLTALSALIGDLQTSTSGARTRIKDNSIRLYDSFNNVIMLMGDSSVS